MSETVYSVYPLTMVHPHFQASKAIPVPGSQVYSPDGQITRQDYQGTPQRFPPVTVISEQDEEYHAAQGYERAGKVDPSAWVRAHAEPPPENYKPQKYPLWRNGQLIMTAQEDPEPDVEDQAEPAETASGAEAAPTQPSESENLRAMVEQMNATMQQMSAQMAQTQAENDRLAAQADELSAKAAKAEELEAMLDQATAPAEADAEPRRRGRPRAVA